MKRLLLSALLCSVLVSSSHAAVVFDQPHNGGGTLHKSSWYAPEGLDSDEFCWDSFVIASSTAITEVHWRGGYQLHPSGTGQSPVYDFDVSIHRSIAGNSQPDLGPGGRLVHSIVGGNAAETPAGSFAGVAMFDYAFTLPSPFQATGGATYWVYIVASQGMAGFYPPDWGLAVGTGGNNFHIRRIVGQYQTITNDLAFSLVGSDLATVTIAASASPTGSGTVLGAGDYPIGSLVSLTASANAGWGFVNWTESGVPVSVNPHYTFTAIAPRTLVANFDVAYTIATFSSPPYGGTTTGDGVYVNGTTVTVTATPHHGFVFNSWSDGSPDAIHTFPAQYDLWLTAFFDSAPDAVTYDFDAGPVGTSLPLDFTVNGLTAHFEGGYSIQPVGTLGITPVGFSGLCLFPNSVFRSDLLIGFSEIVKDFSVLFATQDIACNNAATMRVTAYLGTTLVGTTTIAGPPDMTYPSGTLFIADTNGFDNVVVHWEAPGLGCQNYGPIFLADNVTVTRSIDPGGVNDIASIRPRLFAPAPNPFQRSASIRYELQRASDVRLDVYDLAGRRVRTLVSGTVSVGTHTIAWNGMDDGGRRVSPGVYLLRLEAAGTRESRRIAWLQ